MTYDENTYRLLLGVFHAGYLGEGPVLISVLNVADKPKFTMMAGAHSGMSAEMMAEMMAGMIGTTLAGIIRAASALESDLSPDEARKFRSALDKALEAIDETDLDDAPVRTQIIPMDKKET